MADTKISALSALTAAGTATDDEIAIVDTSVTTTKKQTIAQARISFGPQLGTEQASTSGTEIDFTGIPAGTKRVTINLVGVSLSGTSDILIQIGDAGGPETSGYLGASSAIGTTVASTAYTTGFGIYTTSAAGVVHGSITLSLEDATNFTWVACGVLALSNAVQTMTVAGSKSTSAELTQVRITTVNGSDTFDAGAINISYE